MVSPETSNVPAFAVNGPHTPSISAAVATPGGTTGRASSPVTSV
jgi:hypothetical protein